MTIADRLRHARDGIIHALASTDARAAVLVLGFAAFFLVLGYAAAPDDAAAQRFGRQPREIATLPNPALQRNEIIALLARIERRLAAIEGGIAESLEDGVPVRAAPPRGR